MSTDNKSDGASQPGSNPNRDNAKPRTGARPKAKNTPNASSQTMRLNWIDPLPQVDVIHPLGIEPNVETIPAGYVDLDFELPSTIAAPFVQTISSIGDRLMLADDEKEAVKTSLHALSFFKAARQLYSTMDDAEKTVNQPLKAVYYDEIPIPLHMAGALGIIGHMETKVGRVEVRDASVLFKRWVSRGLQIWRPDLYRPECNNLVWSDRGSFRMVQRLARERIAQLVQATYTIFVDDTNLTVSMPQLVDQDLIDYRAQVTNRVPHADDIRHCVDALTMTYRQYRDDDNIPNSTRDDILGSLRLAYSGPTYSESVLRDEFEEFVTSYNTTTKWRIESIYKTGPPPAGSTGYGAQTVSAVSGGNAARWQFPLSDADVNIGYLFSPSRGFSLQPQLVGYSKRARNVAQTQFANADMKAFARD